MEIMDLIESGRPPRLFQCTWERCKKSFGRKGGLELHYRSHTNERPYSCTKRGCGKSFAQRSALKVHIRTHTGEKPYRCHCGKKFSDSSSLGRHRRIHEKLPYACLQDNCGKRFHKKLAMKDHCRDSHQPVVRFSISSTHHNSNQMHRQQTANWSHSLIQTERQMNPPRFCTSQIPTMYTDIRTQPHTDEMPVAVGDLQQSHFRFSTACSLEQSLADSDSTSTAAIRVSGASNRFQGGQKDDKATIKIQQQNELAHERYQSQQQMQILQQRKKWMKQVRDGRHTPSNPIKTFPQTEQSLIDPRLTDPFCPTPGAARYDDAEEVDQVIQRMSSSFENFIEVIRMSSRALMNLSCTPKAEYQSANCLLDLRLIERMNQYSERLSLAFSKFRDQHGYADTGGLAS